MVCDTYEGKYDFRRVFEDRSHGQMKTNISHTKICSEFLCGSPNRCLMVSYALVLSYYMVSIGDVVRS